MFNKHLLSKPVGARLSPASFHRFGFSAIPLLQYSSMKSSLPFFLSVGTFVPRDSSTHPDFLHGQSTV